MRISDWSSDVCSSDLFLHDRGAGAAETGAGRGDTAGVADLARPGHEAIDVVAGEPGVLNGGENRVDGERQGGVASVASDARLADAGDDDLVLKAVAHAVTDSKRGYHTRSEEHTSELQSLMRRSYAVFCLKKNKQISRS